MSQFRHNALLKRQSTSLSGLSGSLVISNTPTATVLAQDSTAAHISGSYTGIPLAQSTPTPSPTSSSATTPPSSSSGDISLGTVIGVCVGAFFLLVLVIFLAIYCSKRQQPQRRGNTSQFRNTKNSRRRSHLGSWNRLKDNRDRKSDDLPMQRPPSGPMEKLGAMFHRTPSTNSGEKSYDTHGNRESIGTMQHFAQYHPGLAEEMASKPAKPPPVQRFDGRSQADSVPTISWDSRTLGGESFLSMHSRLSGTMTPTATVAKSTPPATASGSHRWESAEVGHLDGDGSEMSEAGDLRSPFADGGASVKSGLSRNVSNPFFNAQEKPKKRTPPANTTPAHDPNPFTDSNAVITRSFPNTSSETITLANSSSNNTQAMQSLIAALEMPPEDRLARVVSMQSSYYSRSSTVMSGDDADVVSVTAFPYPPTHVLLG